MSINMDNIAQVAGAGHMSEWPSDGEPGWRIVEEFFEPDRLGHYESIFALGNGYLGVRGSLDEPYPGADPGTLVAGIFDTVPGAVPEIPVAPEWTGLTLEIGDEVFRLDRGRILAYRRTLDLFRGLLTRRILWRDQHGHDVDLCFERFVSLADPHLAGQRLTVVPLNFSGRLRVASALHGGVTNRGRRHWREISQKVVGADGVSLLVETVQSRVQLAAALRLTANAVEQRATFKSEGGGPGVSATFSVKPGQAVSLEKLVTFYSSRDVGPEAIYGERLLDAALGALEVLGSSGFDRLLDKHVAAWRARWQACDIRIPGDPDAQVAARFAMFHLIQAAPQADERVSIAAKALTGLGYKGHVFWDTEIFVLPFFTFVFPEMARSLLLYRYHTLPGARAKATANGYRGAMYAWESTDTGEETTPAWSDPHPVTGKRQRIWCGEIEQHISADVAYAVWQYCAATGDERFFLDYGAEIILETASFWASRAEYDPERRAYVIQRVIGPDEYHENVDNNFFTNQMARWNLLRGLKTADVLKKRHPVRWRELLARLGMTEAEMEAALTHFREVAAGLFLGWPDEAAKARVPAGVVSQFDGYLDLADVDITAYDRGGVAIHSVLSQEELAKTQVIKQADVVMALYLLGDQFDKEVKEANWTFYEPRCSHGSSLSPAIHAVLAAELGKRAAAYEYFRRAASIDLDDKMGNAADGVHIAALGGIWQAVVMGFAGLRLRGESGETLALAPSLPSRWKGLEFAVKWRGKQVAVSLKAEKDELRLQLSVEGAFGSTEAVAVSWNGHEHLVRTPGTFDL